MKLFYSSGSCSLASHIVLEESGARFAAQRLDLRAGDQRRPEYLRINPKGKVPALALDDEREVLTENHAIISYVADAHPQAGLLAAPGTLARARAQEWLAWCAAGVHASFRPVFRPAEWIDGEDAQQALLAKARATVQTNLDAFDQGLAGKRFVLGDVFSAADAYTLVFALWAGRMGLRAGEHHRASARELLARPGVKRAVATQGLAFEL